MASASLEIHQLNVGQGDAVLIVNRNLARVQAYLQSKSVTVPAQAIDWVPLAVQTAATRGESLPNDTVTCALLVDGGDDDYGGDVVSYLEQHGVVVQGTIVSPRFYVLVSHFHDDHMAGLRSVFKRRVEVDAFAGKKKIKKIEFHERYRPERVYYTAKDKKADPRTQRFGLLKSDIAAASTAAWVKTTVFPLTRGGYPEGKSAITEIPLGNGATGLPIVLKAIAAAQSVYTPGALPTDIKSKNKKVDQNDRSIVLMLEYGSFRYFLGGDIAGNGVADGGNTGNNAMDPGGKRFFSVHADVETTLAAQLQAIFPATKAVTANAPKYPWAGYCTVFKANHHGSSSSNDLFLLSTLRPAIGVISSGLKSRFHGHPTQQVMNRMSSTTSAAWAQRGKGGTVPNSIAAIYLTECADKAKNKTFGANLYGARICGDIVIRPTDESVWAIHTASTTGQKLAVQVYGTAVRTDLADPGNATRAITTDAPSPVPSGPAPAGYAAGPWLHEDTH